MSAKLLAGGRMRRTRQEGTALEDCGDAWRFRYRLGSERPTEYIDKKDCLHNGKPSKKVAEQKKAEFMARVNEGNMKPQTTVTFGQILDKWEVTMLPLVPKESSRATFASRIKVHLRPALAGKRLTDITPESVQAWVSAQQCAPEHVKGNLVLLRMIWKCAKNWGYVEHDPFKGVRRPKIPKGNAYCFSAQEAVAIINAAAGWHRLFYWILYETGMRSGEAAGLTKADVGDRRLTIRQTVWNCQLQSTKTDTVRAIPISAPLYEALQAHIESLAAKTSGLLFSSGTGRPISLHTLRSRHLKPLLDNLGIKAPAGIRVGFHAFRHGSLTELSRAGIPLKTIQKRAGHASGSDVTEMVYLHAVDADSTRAADYMGALIDSKGGTVQ